MIKYKSDLGIRIGLNDPYALNIKYTA
ncbi:MAG: hypothetical protein RIQ30_1022, partial [Pseudomonadota bacterium]